MSSTMKEVCENLNKVGVLRNIDVQRQWVVPSKWDLTDVRRVFNLVEEVINSKLIWDWYRDIELSDLGDMMEIRQKLFQREYLESAR
mmetsp:Transcript_17533/g.28473  ORF Transcript_17533/g.28473 Transcript_17533/m.28473 type:complete len:87 (+) Transcript_17533:74-334(+)